MIAVILAAGNGTRMRPLTNSCPKAMVKLLDKPLLCHILNTLPDEIDEVILVIGYLNPIIKKYFGKKFGRFKITYIEQKEATGTAHALHLCKRLLGKKKFLMLNGDDLHSKKDLEKLLKYPLAVSVKSVKNPQQFGVVTIDKNNKILEITEKPKKPESNLIITGALILDYRIFKYPLIQHSNGEYYITDSLAQLAKEYKIIAVKANFWIPIGYPEDLKKAEKIMRSKTVLLTN